MHLDDLSSFVVLAEELHYGRAAERLDMSQSSLSRQMQRLERTFGVTVFQRNSRNVRLTKAGIILEREAPLLLRGFDQLTELLKSAAGQ